MKNRPRRLRVSQKLRDLVSETKLSKDDLIMPLFVDENIDKGKKEIPSMPGQYRYSLKEIINECNNLVDLGISSIILFGIPKSKDSLGSSAYDKNGIVQRCIKSIKENFGDELVVIGDVCLCEYTDHGHCGIIKNGKIDNDTTLTLLSKIALSYAESGVDIVAPSDMMDGRIKVIRETLERNNYKNVAIMSYSAKYASSFYGPFRDAADSAPKCGIKDRKTYQMDYRNLNEGLREIELDIKEGADLVLVKPAMSYLDVIRESKNRFNIPIGAYSVSGEYSMVEGASRMNWIDKKEVVREILYGIKRAGADFIITYWAKYVCENEIV